MWASSNIYHPGFAWVHFPRPFVHCAGTFSYTANVCLGSNGQVEATNNDTELLTWSAFMWQSNVPRRQPRLLLSSSPLTLQPGLSLYRGRPRIQLNGLGFSQGLYTFVSTWSSGFLMADSLHAIGRRHIPVKVEVHFNICVFTDYCEEPRLWPRPQLCLELTKFTNSFFYIHKYSNNWFLTNSLMKKKKEWNYSMYKVVWRTT